MSDNGPRIFISYRRSDRALAAHWVHREVAGKFGKEAVFFDVDGIPAGFDYRVFLQEKVSECDVLLAVIGDDWLDVRDAHGERRLDHANDFVRIEIEAALQRNILVIPVLVENARMPASHELPTSLHQLAYRQAREVRSGHHLDDHFRQLNESIERAWRIHRERAQRIPATAARVFFPVPDHSGKPSLRRGTACDRPPAAVSETSYEQGIRSRI